MDIDANVCYNEKMKLKHCFDKLLPQYTRLPLLGCVILNFAVYFGTSLFDLNYVNLVTPADRLIPMIPSAVIVYVLAFPFWVINYILIARENSENCGILFGEMAAKLICLLFFLLLPTETDLPRVEGKDFFSWLVRLIYFMDRPVNLFPSIHCLESWLCWRGLFGCKKVCKGYKAFSLVFALMVFASTLLIHQHLIVDVPSAVIVAEIGLFMSRKLQLGERYARRLAVRRGV